MQVDSLTHLSRAIETAVDAAATPALVLVGAAVLAVAAQEISAQVRRRRARVATPTVIGRRSKGGSARGAET